MSENVDTDSVKVKGKAKAFTTVRGSRVGKFCNHRMVVEVRVIIVFFVVW